MLVCLSISYSLVVFLCVSKCNFLLSLKLLSLQLKFVMFVLFSSFKAFTINILTLRIIQILFIRPLHMRSAIWCAYRWHRYNTGKISDRYQSGQRMFCQLNRRYISGVKFTVCVALFSFLLLL